MATVSKMLLEKLVGVSSHLCCWLRLWWAAYDATSPAFTYNETTFLLDGKPVQLIGGQMDPQRVPAQYWRHRLQMARALGINTIFSYIFWDRLEPSRGLWTSKCPQNDIAAFFEIAQEEGLWVVLRPGPYICGEHDYCGFPAWLTQIPGMVVRHNNEPFLRETERYVSAVSRDLGHLQVTKGGPILMVQVENEYGSFGYDLDYMIAVRDIVRNHFEVPLYTNDGGVDWTLEGGSVPGVLAAVDGEPAAGFAARRMYVTDPTRLGPLVDGEYYTLAADVWGSSQAHQSTINSPETVEKIISAVQYILGQRSASMNLYMLHGGTNFGFDNGALWQNRSTVFTTSYDFGAPIDESGRPTELYWALRKALAPFHPLGSVPSPPHTPGLMSIPFFTLYPSFRLLDRLGNGVLSDSPLSMEAMGQSHGFILYEHTSEVESSGTIRPGDRPRDRVQVYVNDHLKGVIDSQYEWPRNVSIELHLGDNLKLLIENLGRVDYFSRDSAFPNHLSDPYKGVVGDVTVGGAILSGWKIHSISLEALMKQGDHGLVSDLSQVHSQDLPWFYTGFFNVSSSAADCEDPISMDTFLAIPDGVRGQVFVNGFNLGRYWRVGPQQSLYLPGCLLRCDEPNEVVVLELSPRGQTRSLNALGLAAREWFNRPDPECAGCVPPPVTKAPGQHDE